MLNWAFEQLAVEFSGFNVFRYLTFRAICGVVTAMVICFIVGPRMIERLGRLQIGENHSPRWSTYPLQQGGHSDHGGRPDLNLNRTVDPTVG